MLVLDVEKSNMLREKYISAFINTKSPSYIERIKTLTQFSDGLCYVGYLWDCLKKPVVVSKAELVRRLKNKKNIYIMWDLHSADRIFIPNYWKHPKECVLFVETWSEDLYEELPEDIYIFDDTFTWSAIFTHETDINNDPYCLYMGDMREKEGQGDGSPVS